MRAFWCFLALVLAAAPTLGEANDSLPFPLDPETKTVRFQEVVLVEGVSANDLMARARTWVALAYKSAPDVTKLDDQSKLIIKGLYHVAGKTVFAGEFNFNHTLTIDVKDGRFRYTMSDFVLTNPPGVARFEFPLEQYQAKSVKYKGLRDTLTRGKVEADALIASLKKAMQSPTPSDEEW